MEYNIYQKSVSSYHILSVYCISDIVLSASNVLQHSCEINTIIVPSLWTKKQKYKMVK